VVNLSCAQVVQHPRTYLALTDAKKFGRLRNANEIQQPYFLGTSTALLINTPFVAICGMAQFRAKRLDLGGFINIKIIRDHTKRKVFEKYEPERYPSPSSPSQPRLRAANPMFGIW
jgi:hypothetical protein